MKKLLISILVLMLSASALADNVTASDGKITFRNFEWYAPFAEVDQSMLTELCLNEDSRKLQENINLDTTANTIVMVNEPSEECLLEGGVQATYYQVPVSDYTAMTDMYYIYPLGDNGLIKDRSKAKLIMGRYSIFGYDDMDAVHTDLIDTLSSLYGEGFPYTSDTVTFNFWYDSDYNLVCSVYVSQIGILIYYMPSDIDDKIVEYNTALANMDIDTGKKHNTDGL